MKNAILLTMTIFLVLNVVLATIFLLAEMYLPAIMQMVFFPINCFTFWRALLDDDDDLRIG